MTKGGRNNNRAHPGILSKAKSVAKGNSMKLFNPFTTIGFSILTVSLSWISSVEARPYPDTVGVCYSFQGDDIERLEPCVISSGSGAGAQYASLNWLDGQTTTIEMSAYCPNQDWDENGFCSYFVNGEVAEAYERDVFWMESNSDSDDEDMPCYRLSSQLSYCYRKN
ncbi:hypothetical protein VB780_26030 [Leptolyngbya sp. CCNP1308]|uniref:hypothetical protein n=1 Tax=Leptolyngbya sp. CCNP1308 TaxID=3110255 RepID=UPI002B20CF5B|nr:hypothetical protein [Leptolyngbya sp. CCNP1308]MEA5452060.1 hypothetical protein [Leptolyngbya sp. CCNP1308]